MKVISGVTGWICEKYSSTGLSNKGMVSSLFETKRPLAVACSCAFMRCASIE
jgi:hypothetical protein